MRRTLPLAVTVVAIRAATLPSPIATSAAAQVEDGVRILHVVVDGLHPSEVGPDTPFLQSLKDAGTWWEQHRSIMSAETLPNHVAMATGTYAERHGLPGNDGRAAPGDAEAVDLGDPALRQAISTTATIEQVCPDLATLTVFAKPYVYATFAGEADRDFDQSQFNVPVAETAPDVIGSAFVQQDLAANGIPDHAFVSFGDVDRAGHVDINGFLGQTAFQRVALAEVDAYVELLVQTYQQAGVWDETVMIVNSDHSMDWSVVGQGQIDVIGALEGDPATAGAFFGATNGGTMFVNLNDPGRADIDTVLAQARTVLTAVDGVDEVLYREPNPLDPGFDVDTVHPGWRIGTDRMGELIVTAQDGFKAGSLSEVPVPGNHGHIVTRHATMMITGGWDGLADPQSVSADPALVDLYDDTEVLTDQSENVDIAPTIGWLTGVPDPGLLAGGAAQWQGRVLEEAFTRQPSPICAAAVSAPAPAPALEPEPEPLPVTGGGLALAGLVAGAVAALRRRG